MVEPDLQSLFQNQVNKNIDRQTDGHDKSISLNRFEIRQKIINWSLHDINSIYYQHPTLYLRN